MASMNPCEGQERTVRLPVAERAAEDGAESAQGQQAPLSPDAEEAILQRSIQLQEVDSDVFLASKDDLWKPLGARGVFGGQIIGQTLHAAILSVPPGMAVHSFHGYFMLAGDPERNIILHVKRIRDGGSFATRAVEARQQGKTIFSASLQFHKSEPSGGLEVEPTMPKVRGPEGLKSDREVLMELAENPKLSKRMQAYYQEALAWTTREERRVAPVPEGTDPLEPVEYFWSRVNGKLGSDRNIHMVALAYMSDASMLTCAYVPFGGMERQKNQPSMMVSLDHAMWFHCIDGFRADDWLLFEIRCVRAGSARILSFLKVWTQQGTLIFSAAQEGLARHTTPLQRLPAPAASTAKL